MTVGISTEIQSHIVNAGSLRHRVSLQKKTPTTTELGQKVNQYLTQASGVPARIEPLLGSELEKAKALVPQASTMIVMRYFRQLTEGWRVVFADAGVQRIFDIGNVIDVGYRHQKHVLTCSEAKSV